MQLCNKVQNVLSQLIEIFKFTDDLYTFSNN